MMIDYSLVVGVDAKHLKQLEMVWPTWRKHKPGLLKHPMFAFFDYTQTSEMRVRAAVDHPDMMAIEWPPPGSHYPEDPSLGKFGGSQRYKMLAGFVHVPPAVVNTTYWLKLDTDVVATGVPDWIDAGWFSELPAIVSHPWGFTKPANQMVLLDQWAEENKLPGEPLNLVPEPGSDRVRHKRIISWCGFFHSEFTNYCSVLANGDYKYGLPVPSQDGYLWYLAQRTKQGACRCQMKTRGWEHWSTEENIRRAVERAMA